MVAAYDALNAGERGWSTTKIYTERMPQSGEPLVQAASGAAPRAAPRDETASVAQARGKSERLDRGLAKPCGPRAWPHVAPDCLADPPRPVRVITIETRAGEATSVLTRVPGEDAAQP
jgi:hypothetical protein